MGIFNRLRKSPTPLKVNLSENSTKKQYNALNNTQKARFRNFKNRYPGKSHKNIYNQIMREKEHSYTPSEKGNIHHLLNTNQAFSLKQAHNKILKMREPTPGFGAHSYFENR